MEFMRKTGLLDLIANHLVNNLVDYVLGIETGLDSNGRKNRGGHQMEDLVEGFIKQTDAEYYKEMYITDIEKNGVLTSLQYLLKVPPQSDGTLLLRQIESSMSSKPIFMAAVVLNLTKQPEAIK